MSDLEARARQTIAILALLSLGGLIVTLERGSYGVDPRLVFATRLLLVPLGLTVIGLVMEKVWSRWLALAGAIAVLPWAVVLTFGMPRGAPLVQQTIALVASLLLLVSLSGRAMFERYEGNAATDWSGPDMGLVRWTIILNMASALGLLLFVVVYRYAIEWHVAIPAVLLAGLALGVLLLARQMTAGLLLVAVSCILFRAGWGVLRVEGGEPYRRDLPLRRCLPARHHRRLGLPGRLRGPDVAGVARGMSKGSTPAPAPGRTRRTPPRTGRCRHRCAAPTRSTAPRPPGS